MENLVKKLGADGVEAKRQVKAGKQAELRMRRTDYFILLLGTVRCFYFFFPVSQGICGKFNSNSFATALRFFEDSQVEYIIDWDSGCSGNRVS